jgi:hypothetical protein
LLSIADDQRNEGKKGRKEIYREGKINIYEREGKRNSSLEILLVISRGRDGA